MTTFGRYLESLVGSWEALAVPHHDATVVCGAGFVASRFPRQPVLNNAVLLDAVALPEVLAIFNGTPTYAVWSLMTPRDTAVAGALQSAGMHRDITTCPMVLELDSFDGMAGASCAVRTVSPEVVAALNGVPAELLDGVPGLRAHASADGRSGLVLVPVGADVNVSFVATRPDARGQGLASTVLRSALSDARGRGFLTATLQATPMAEALYAGAGFVAVGRWQEWLPARI